jgi:hypothetical protein
MNKTAHRARDREYKRKARAAKRDEYNAYMRKYNLENKKRVNMSKQQRRYLPTRARPDNCEACGVVFSTMHFGACVDHDHKTGKFRGWLCTHCNLALGHLKDSHDRIQKLALYLDMAVMS